MKQRLLSMLKADQATERWEEPVHSIEAPNAPEAAEMDLCESPSFGSYLLPADEVVVDDNLDLRESPSFGSYLLPANEVVVDDNLPVLVNLPMTSRWEWGSRS